MSAPKNIMEVTEGEKAMLLAFRRAGLTVTPYTGSAALNETINASLHQVNETTPVTRRCAAQGRGDTQCIKNAEHGQRHRYGPKAASIGHRPPLRSWTKINDAWVRNAGYTKRLHFVVGNPCRVTGERGMWKIISMEQHTESGRINVEVTADRTGHSRTFPVEKIIYKRPQKVSA